MSVQATFSATLVDEWSRLGVTDAVICPGSRSTPLALALAARLRTHVRLDERSAGFYALGIALATERPTVVCVTSGTAAAELHAAVVEAHHARVPLIVCTADRPPELHHTGAPQTIEQVGLFGAATRWAVSPGVPSEEQQATWRPLAVRAHAEATRGAAGPGPVHLNLAFREPLTGDAGALPARPGPEVAGTGAAARPASIDPLRGRGVLIVGGLAPRPPDPRRVAALSERLGWPVMADPLSGSRVVGTVAAADTIVRTRPPLPESVVLLGAPLLSRALGTYVADAAAAGARVVVIDPWAQWADPSRVATEFHQGDADVWLADAAQRAEPCDPEWLHSWRHREARAQEAIDTVLGRELSEPQVARALFRRAAASRRHRFRLGLDADTRPRVVRGVRRRAARVLANRGANGIDGVVSTALGIATGSGRTLALLGDLAFLHDVSGLVNLPPVPCTFVVVDNGGGGIFSFLPQATSLGHREFEHLFGTPPRSDLGAVARGFGLPVHDVTALSELEAALADVASTPEVVRVRVPGRAENVALHDAINEAVRLALT